MEVVGWGGVRVLGKGNFHFCDGCINIKKYTEILEQHIWSSKPSAEW